MNLKNIGNKIGFTKTEFNVLFTLIIFFVIGLIFKIYQYHNGNYEISKFGYSHSDSLFYSTSHEIDSLDTVIAEKSSVLSKDYVLELNKRDTIQNGEKLSGNEKIKINSAGISELVRLPGIGEKTANKILKLRSQRGKFIQLDELKDVQGIGTSKFENIKNYIIID